MILFILSLVIGGLIIGALGRLAVPGPNPMSVGMTILVGIGGSLLGGLVGNVLFGRPGGWILAVLCTALIVWLMQRSQGRRTAF
ncbi:MAG: GlsB/YeaQ/YmgE family stress response membrane protein [Acidimicrobiales bacterium]